MVGLTGLIFVATFLQWQATRDIIGVTGEEFRKGNRAYVTVTGYHVRSWVSNPDGTTTLVERTKFPVISTPRSHVQVDLRNTGNTPAQDVRTVIAICVCGRIPDDTAAEAAKVGDHKGSAVPLAKEGMLYPGALSPVISNSDLEDILSSKKIFGAFGSATYRDIFGEPHRTDFCFQYDPKTNGLIGCEEGNKLN
jgi:hypothetical protein